MSGDPVLERARAGDVGAFVDLARRHDPELSELAGEWLAGLARGAAFPGDPAPATAPPLAGTTLAAS